MAHIANGDQRLFRFAEVVRQATTFFTRIGWLALLFAIPLMLFGYIVPFAGFLVLIGAPIVSYFLEMALLRTREFAADTRAAELSGDPMGLARALSRIEYVQQSLMRSLFPIYRQTETTLFRSHPATGQRIEKLKALDKRTKLKVVNY
jgi:heat shock protein HtpX